MKNVKINLPAKSLRGIWPVLFHEIDQSLKDGAEGVQVECGKDIGSVTPKAALGSFRSAQRNDDVGRTLNAYERTDPDGLVVYRKRVLPGLDDA